MTEEQNYDSKEYNSDNQLYIVEKNGKYGFIKESGDEITPVIFDYYDMDLGFAIVRKGNQAGNLFFHEGTKEPLAYRTVDIFEVKRNGKFGVENSDNKCIIPCQYDFARIYNTIVVCRTDTNYFLFNLQGEKIIDRSFDDVNVIMFLEYHYYAPLNSSANESALDKGICVKADDKWGVISQTGKWIVPLSVESLDDIYLIQHKQPAFDLYDNYYAVDIKGKTGIFNKQGIPIIPCIYDEIRAGNDFLADSGRTFIVTLKKKYGLYNLRGDLIYPCIYDWIRYITDDIYLIRDRKKNIVVVDLEKNLNNNQDMVEELNTDCIDIHSERTYILSEIANKVSSNYIFYAHDKEYLEMNKEYYSQFGKENAIKWYLLAASFGNEFTIEACYRIFKHGVGVAVNERKAENFLLRANHLDREALEKYFEAQYVNGEYKKEVLDDYLKWISFDKKIVNGEFYYEWKNR